MASTKKMMNALSLVIAVFLFTACASNGVTKEESLIIEKLSEVNGDFIWNAKLKRHVFSEMERIEKITAHENSDELIAVLVSCIDDVVLSHSTLDGKKVPVGVVCYQALSQTAYYEPTDSEGDIKGSWPGHILPTADIKEMEEAKRAWVDVVNSKSYILY